MQALYRAPSGQIELSSIPSPLRQPAELRSKSGVLSRSEVNSEVDGGGKVLQATNVSETCRGAFGDPRYLTTKELRSME